MVKNMSGNNISSSNISSDNMPESADISAFSQTLEQQIMENEPIIKDMLNQMPLELMRSLPSYQKFVDANNKLHQSEEMLDLLIGMKNMQNHPNIDEADIYVVSTTFFENYFTTPRFATQLLIARFMDALTSPNLADKKPYVENVLMSAARLGTSENYQKYTEIFEAFSDELQAKMAVKH